MLAVLTAVARVLGAVAALLSGLLAARRGRADDIRDARATAYDRLARATAARAGTRESSRAAAGDTDGGDGLPHDRYRRD